MTAQSSIRLLGGTLPDALLLGSGQKVDLNGEAGGLVLDADGDTYIGASTEDQILITIDSGDDFLILSNIFRALSGSSIQTNTIDETTADAGVTIDGTLIKDLVVYARSPFGAVSASGAIAIPAYDKNFFITKSSAAAAMTLADPTATTHDGIELTFIATTAQAHTLDNSAGSGFWSSGGSSKDVATFGGAIGDRITIIAYQGKWYIKDSLNITLG